MTDAAPPPDELASDALVGGELVADEEEAGPGGEGHHDLLDRLRGTGVGVEDPNIVGDAGPTDVAPGRDGPGDGLFADPPEAPPAGP